LVTAWNQQHDFQKTRLRFTGIYILILFILFHFFIISFFFVLQQEEQKYTKNINVHWEKKQVIIPSETVTVIELEMQKNMPNAENIIRLHNIFVNTLKHWMVLIEGVFLIVGSILSYILAGKTLNPIKKREKKQKQFLTDVTHELKNPLSALKTSLEIAKTQTKWRQGEVQELCSDLESEISRLSKLTEDLLVLEQKKGKKWKHTSPTISIQENIERLSSFAKQRNIHIETHFSECNIQIPQKAFEHVIFNLLHNAIKFSHPNGEIHISLQKTGILQIQDFGIGISQKDIPYIFHRFYKSDSSRTFTEDNGSGLGLSIVKKICHEQGWNISVQSTDTEGTIFRIRF
jgi:signal transduction histidine kinase